jgi:hypothetical protein
VKVLERPASSPAAGISGTTAGWVAALTPPGDETGLQISDDAALAAAVLAQLS